MMLQDKRLLPGHFIKYLGTLHGSQHGGVKALYDSLPAGSGATIAEVGSGSAEQRDGVAATQTESAGAATGVEGAHAVSVPALVDGETGSADVQPTPVDTAAAPAPPPQDNARRRAEKGLARLTAIWASLLAKHSDAEDPFFDHVASVCNVAHGQLVRLDAATLVDSAAALAFISNPEAPAGLSKQRLRPFISPKKKGRGQGRVSAPLAAESSPVKPEAAKFFVPVKHKSSLLEDVGKQQTAGMQKKADFAEARARAKLQAKKQPQSGTVGGRATAEIDFSGISNGTGKENTDTAPRLPGSQQQPQAGESTEQFPHSHGLMASAQIVAEHAAINCNGPQRAGCSSPALSLGSQPLAASVEPSNQRSLAKRRRVQPSWLSESVHEF
jgi:hypothetical protein